MTTRRIVRVPICHLTVFERLLGGVQRARGTVRSHGCDWRLVSNEEGVRIYERADFGLGWLRETVQDYERELYRLLATAVVGSDGYLHRRTSNVTKDLGGAYRPRTSRGGIPCARPRL